MAPKKSTLALIALALSSGVFGLADMLQPGYEPEDKEYKPKKPKTDEDFARIAKAEAKRARKAEKRRRDADVG